MSIFYCKNYLILGSLDNAENAKWKLFKNHPISSLANINLLGHIHVLFLFIYLFLFFCVGLEMFCLLIQCSLHRSPSVWPSSPDQITLVSTQPWSMLHLRGQIIIGPQLVSLVIISMTCMTGSSPISSFIFPVDFLVSFNST